MARKPKTKQGWVFLGDRLSDWQHIFVRNRVSDQVNNIPEACGWWFIGAVVSEITGTQVRRLVRGAVLGVSLGLARTGGGEEIDVPMQ